MTFNLTPCRFTFDGSPEFDGFSYGTTWNGFDNVCVLPQVRDKIVAYFELDGCDSDTIASLRDLPVREEGVVSLAGGWATQIVRKALPFTVGQRVITTDFVDNFPTVLCNAGETGTVEEITDERIMVRMDRHFPELNEWTNSLEIWLWDDVEVPLAPLDPVARVGLSADAPSCAVAIAEAIHAVAGKATRAAGTKEGDRLLAVVATLQAILMQRGCGADENQNLTQIMDEAIFG